MKTWQDINEAIPAAPGIYWTKREFGSSKPMLTYYFGHYGGWAYIDTHDGSEQKLNLTGTLTPDLWAPVNPPEN